MTLGEGGFCLRGVTGFIGNLDAAIVLLRIAAGELRVLRQGHLGHQGSQGWVGNALEPDYAFPAETIETLRSRLAAPLLGLTAYYDPLEPALVAGALAAGVRRLTT